MKRTLITILAILPLFTFAQSYTDDNSTAIGSLILFLIGLVIHPDVSRKGISAPIAIRGARANIAPKRTFLNTNICGTGVYNRELVGRLNNQSPLSREV